MFSIDHLTYFVGRGVMLEETFCGATSKRHKNL